MKISVLSNESKHQTKFNFIQYVNPTFGIQEKFIKWKYTIHFIFFFRFRKEDSRFESK